MSETIVAMVVVSSDGGVPGESLVDRIETFVTYAAAVYRAEEIEQVAGWHCAVVVRSDDPKSFVAVER